MFLFIPFVITECQRDYYIYNSSVESLSLEICNNQILVLNYLENNFKYQHIEFKIDGDKEHRYVYPDDKYTMFLFKDKATVNFHLSGKTIVSLFVTSAPDKLSPNGITHVLTNKKSDNIKISQTSKDVYISALGYYYLNGNVTGENVVFQYYENSTNMRNITDQEKLKSIDVKPFQNSFFYVSDKSKHTYSGELLLNSFTDTLFDVTTPLTYSYTLDEYSKKELPGNQAIGPDAVTNFSEINYWGESSWKIFLAFNRIYPVFWILYIAVFLINNFLQIFYWIIEKDQCLLIMSNFNIILSGFGIIFIGAYIMPHGDLTVILALLIIFSIINTVFSVCSIITILDEKTSSVKKKTSNGFMELLIFKCLYREVPLDYFINAAYYNPPLIKIYGVCKTGNFYYQYEEYLPFCTWKSETPPEITKDDNPAKLKLENEFILEDELQTKLNKRKEEIKALAKKYNYETEPMDKMIIYDKIINFEYFNEEKMSYSVNEPDDCNCNCPAWLNILLGIMLILIELGAVIFVFFTGLASILYTIYLIYDHFSINTDVTVVKTKRILSDYNGLPNSEKNPDYRGIGCSSLVDVKLKENPLEKVLEELINKQLENVKLKENLLEKQAVSPEEIQLEDVHTSVVIDNQLLDTSQIIILQKFYQENFNKQQRKVEFSPNISYFTANSYV